jgi:hypothetical protein
LSTCHYCFGNIFCIKHVPFEDPEGSVKHECQHKKKLSDSLSDRDKINAIYNFTIKIKLTVDTIKQQQDELIKKFGEHDARK